MFRIALTPLKEAIPSLDLFANMTSLSFIPDATVAAQLDLEYFFNHSGTKEASPLTERYIDDPEISTKLAGVILNRYRVKWENLFRSYSSLSTLDLLKNISLTSQTTYGKQISKDADNYTSKSGSETWTLRGTVTETTSSSSNNPYTMEKTISGSYKDTSDRSNAHRGTQEVLEEYPQSRRSEKTTTGGYKDTDTTATARTGAQKTTDKGGMTSSVYGYNSSSAVPASISAPSDPTLGTTSELEYVGNGIVDTRSGNIHREYDSGGLIESTVESGSTKVSTSFGIDGITDTESGGVERTYTNYRESTTQTGSRSTSTDYGSGKTNELSFTNRRDSVSVDETEIQSGSDVTTQSGYKLNSLLSEYLGLFMSAEYIDFLSIVYDDCDEVLTCPFYVQ